MKQGKLVDQIQARRYEMRQKPKEYEIWEKIEAQKRADAKVNSFMTFWHKTGLLQSSLEKWLNLIKTSNVGQLQWNYACILPIISVGLNDDDQALLDFVSFWHIF